MDGDVKTRLKLFSKVIKVEKISLIKKINKKI